MKQASVRLLASVLGILFSFLCAAGAATYYVDQSHAEANDGNPGTEALPWLTIQKAANTMAAGDTVYVRSGTYQERVLVQSSGSAGSWVNFSAFPGDEVIIDGTGVTVDEYSGLFEVYGAAYVVISGFRVTNAGPHVTSAGIQVESSSHVMILDCSISNTASSGIIVASCDNVVIDGNEITLANTVEGSHNEALSVLGTDTFEIRDNYVHHVSKEGIDAKDGSSNGKVLGNHVSHAQSTGLYVDAWDKHTFNIEVCGNRVHDVQGSGIQIGNEAGGLLESVGVHNNISYNNDWVGIAVHDCCDENGPDHPISEVLIINNTSANNGWTDWGGGIAVDNEQATGVVVRNNICSGNSYFEIALGGLVAPAAVTVEYNLIHSFHDTEGEIRGQSYQEGDPLFVNASAGDFRLRPGSPAIDNGSFVAAPAVDYDGRPRPHGPGVDIGAFEYSPVLFTYEGRQPTQLSFNTTRDWDPYWSPDGSQLVFTSDRGGVGHLWIMPAEGCEPVQLTFGNRPDMHPCWSPDGARIAFESTRSGNQDIWVVAASGGEPRQITVDGHRDESLDWSHRGNRITFDSNRSGSWDIWTIGLDGSDPVRLTNHGSNTGPAGSPDGAWIAFTSDRSGTVDLWMTPSDGGTAVQLTAS